MAMVYELWRQVAVKDEMHSTWELVDRFSNHKLARQRIHELAGSNVVSPEDGTYWYEDIEGEHRFRIEVVPAGPPRSG